MVVIDAAAADFDELIRPYGMRRTGISFVGPDGVTHLTYDQLARRAAAASRDLRERGVAPGGTVAMVLDSRPTTVAAALGVWLAGATLMSLPPAPRELAGPAPQLYRERFGDVLRFAECSLALGSERLARALAPNHHVTDPATLDFDSGRAAPDVAAPDVALVQFTSGSTGAPKGVVLRSDTLASHAVAVNEGTGFNRTGEIAVSWLPLYHDMGLIGMLLGVMRSRGSLVLMAPGVFARDPGSWLRTCAESRATLTCAPDFAYRLAARVTRFGKPVGDLSTLRVCLCGAERVSWATIEAFADATRTNGFRREAFMPVYGMSEATLAVSFPPHGRGPQLGPDGMVGVGRPLPGVELRIEESGSGPGRIGLRGPWMLESYLTARGHVDPFDADGWFWTNDVGFVEDGELYVVGRTDEAVITRGRNVYAEDVEAIATSTAGVDAFGAAAFRAPDADDRFVLVVEVLSDAGAELARFAHQIKSSVTQALETRVSPVLFVKPKTIPRTTSGKPIRSACRDAYARLAWDSDSVLANVR